MYFLVLPITKYGLSFFDFCEYFNKLALEVSKHFKFEYCTQQAEDIMNYLKNMRRRFKTKQKLHPGLL